MPFTPAVDETLRIDRALYRVGAHPAVPAMPYGQTGRKATVYALNDEAGARRALKVFAQAFRSTATSVQSAQLRPFATLPGLQVCERVTLTPEQHAPLLQRFPDLCYAVLMPWVEGPTWQEVVLEQTPLEPTQCLAMARSLVVALAALEARGAAHCDLSGANLLVQPAGGSVALVDVEELFAPGLARPQRPPAGSPGYAHRSAAGGLWADDADRFAGAVLLAEMLVWHVPAIKAQAAGESFFDPPELQRDTARARLLADVLRRHAPIGIAELFSRAWASIHLGDCPSLAEWAAALSVTRSVPQAHEVGAAKPTVTPVAAPSGLSMAEAERQVRAYAEAYQIAPAIAAISYGRALQRRGVLREQAADPRSALDDYQAALGVAPNGELGAELRAAVARVATIAATAPATAAKAAMPAAAQPRVTQHPVQHLEPVGGGAASVTPVHSLAAPTLDTMPWPAHLQGSSREQLLRALTFVALLLGALIVGAGVGLESRLLALQNSLTGDGNYIAQEILAGGLLGSLCAALYAYGLRTRLDGGQRVAAVWIGALGGACGGWLAMVATGSLQATGAGRGLIVGAIEGAAAGLCIGIWLDATLGDGTRRWTLHGLYAWSAIWALGLGLSQLLIPSFGLVIGPAVGWSLTLIGCGLLLVQMIAHRRDLEV